MTPIIDGHLDLAMNAVSFERDLTLPIDQINDSEQHCRDAAARGTAVVSLAEMRRGGIALCFATLLARARPNIPLPVDGAKRIDLDYRSSLGVHCVAHAQLAWYEFMARQGHARIIRSVADLEGHWQSISDDLKPAPLGVVIVMEGADPVTEPDELDYWFDCGLRQINLVHYGVNQYAAGTGAKGGLTKSGRQLLRQCEKLGVALDTTHLADQAFFEAMDLFAGGVLASHQNCRALVTGDRQFSDEQLRLLIGRDAIIGAALDNWMLLEGWKSGHTTRDRVTLQVVADHIDHVCQLAGNHLHTALGTDLDGGFGHEQAPVDIDSIADLQRLAATLSSRGYGDDSIAEIFHGNWLRWLRRHLPHESGALAADASQPERSLC